MKKNDSKNEYESLLIALVVSFICVVIINIIGRNTMPETFEDVVFNLISAGAFGEKSQFLFFQNIIIGYVLKILYYFIPTINWYLTCQILLNLGAVSLLTERTIRDYGKFLGIIICVILNFFLGFDIYINIQFTVNSLFYSVVGFILFCEGLAGDEKKKVVFGCLYIILSFLIRTYCFLFMLPYGILLLIQKNIYIVRPSDTRLAVKVRGGYKKLLSYLSVLFMSCLFFGVLNYCVYYTDPEWRELSEYATVNSRLLDYMPAVYNNRPDEYESKGITELDIAMFNNMVSMDTENYTVKKLQDIESIKAQDENYNLRLDKDVFITVGVVLSTVFSWSAIGIVLTVILSILVIAKEKKDAVFVIMSAIIFIGELWYLVCKGRPVWRVVIGPVIGFELTMLYYGIKNCKTIFLKINKSVMTALLCTCLAVIVLMKIPMLNSGWDCYVDEKVFMELCADKNSTYVMDSWLLFNDKFGIKHQMTITRSDYKDRFENIIIAGSYLPHFPSVTGYKNRGIENPIRDLVKDDVYWVVCDVYGEQLTQVLNEYLEEKLERDVDCFLVCEQGGIQVWKFR